ASRNTSPPLPLALAMAADALSTALVMARPDVDHSRRRTADIDGAGYIDVAGVSTHRQIAGLRQPGHVDVAVAGPNIPARKTPGVEDPRKRVVSLWRAGRERIGIEHERAAAVDRRPLPLQSPGSHCHPADGRRQRQRASAGLVDSTDSGEVADIEDRTLLDGDGAGSG